jgi:hypothetical protein
VERLKIGPALCPVVVFMQETIGVKEPLMEKFCSKSIVPSTVPVGAILKVTPSYPDIGVDTVN